MKLLWLFAIPIYIFAGVSLITTMLEHLDDFHGKWWLPGVFFAIVFPLVLATLIGIVLLLSLAFSAHIPF